MSAHYLLLADLVAITVLVFGVYFPRHRRRDLVIAYLGINVGVLAVSTALSSATVGAGLGLGLFGVLSIIRLRSAELDQHEIAYYFSALALGLLGGLATVGLLPLALMVMVVTAMYVGGHPRLLRRYRQQLMLIDRAFTDEQALLDHLEQLLGARMHRVTVQKVDLVNDTTMVDVRFQIDPASTPHSDTAPASSGRLSSTVR
jgi:Domain of unknown function (DUF4956)